MKHDTHIDTHEYIEAHKHKTNWNTSNKLIKRLVEGTRKQSKRKSNKKRSHEIKLKKIKVFSSIFSLFKREKSSLTY